MYDKDGKSVVGFSLSTSWVAATFHPKFLELVRNVGIKENTRNLQWSKRKWIPVPAGNVKDEKAPQDIIHSSVHCRYQQNDFSTCVFKSMASVFHHAGRKDVASYLSLISHARGTEVMDVRQQLERLRTEVRKRETLYRKVDFLTNEKAIARLDIYKPDASPQLCILLGKDGGTNHAVGVIQDYVFNSNVSNALKFSKTTLDWCCNCTGGFTRIHMYLCFSK